MTYSQLAEALTAYADEEEAWDEEVPFTALIGTRTKPLEMSDGERGFVKGVIHLEEIAG